MIAEPRTVVLPDADEMQRRLLSVDDAQRSIEQFHPLLIAYAEREMNFMNIAMMFLLAIFDYTEKDSTVANRSLLMRVPIYLKALIDDVDMRADVVRFLNDADIPACDM